MCSWLRGCRKPCANGTCQTAKALMLHPSLLVRCKVHEKDTLLASQPTAIDANNNIPESQKLRQLLPRKIPLQNISRGGKGHCLSMVWVYPQWNQPKALKSPSSLFAITSLLPSNCRTIATVLYVAVVRQPFFPGSFPVHWCHDLIHVFWFDCSFLYHQVRDNP